jgi:transcriptional antiterminator RfaH
MDTVQDQWRAVFCRPRQESRAEAHLENQGFDVFLPRIRVRERRGASILNRVEAMFPRYLFVRVVGTGSDWSTIRSTRGAIGLVRFGDRVPVISEHLIDALRNRHGRAGVVDISSAMEIQPDDPVEITHGPMAGLRAIFRAKTSQERVVILLNLLNNEREIQLPSTQIRKVV